MAAARNLGQLRQAVEDLGVGQDSASAINGFINGEWKNLASMRRWSWQLNTSSNTIAVGASSFTLNAAVNDGLEGMWFQDATGAAVRPVRFLDPVRLFAYVEDLVNPGPPQYWTVIAGTVKIAPVADATYTATYLYSTGANVLAVDSDVPLGLPGGYDEILVWGSLARSAVRQNNWLVRDYATQQRDALINRLLTNDGMQQRQNPDEMETTGMWSQPDPLRDFWPWR